MGSLFGVNLRELTDKLFIPARDAYTAIGAEIVFTNEGNNPELTVTKGDKKIVLPMYKNYAIVGDKKVDLGSVTVFNGEKVFVPQTAIDLVK